MVARRGVVFGTLGIALMGGMLAISLNASPDASGRFVPVGSRPADDVVVSDSEFASASSLTAATADDLTATADDMTGTGEARIERTASSCVTGSQQRVVEEYLAQHTEFGPVTVDGRLTGGECQTIKNFQQRFGLRPVDGIPGPNTAGVVNRLKSANIGACESDVVGAFTVCVDLTSQTAWATRDGKVVYGPTVVRTGRKGYETPQGKFRVNVKKQVAISQDYHVPMPYWQHFWKGMGLHTTVDYIHSAPGSHGCVNMLDQDAKYMYQNTSAKSGSATRVHVFGTKPGTATTKA